MSDSQDELRPPEVIFDAAQQLIDKVKKHRKKFKWESIPLEQEYWGYLGTFEDISVVVAQNKDSKHADGTVSQGGMVCRLPLEVAQLLAQSGLAKSKSNQQT